MSNLASTYADLDRAAAAEQLGRETLALEQRVLGPDHPQTLVTEENLARVLFRSGNLAASEQLVLAVLEGRKRALGPDHPDVTKTMYNLAMLRKANGADAGAEALFVEALRRNRRDLPAGHPTIADCLGRIAALRTRAKDYAAAEVGFREALAIRAAIDPDVAATTELMHNLGLLLLMRGDVDQAVAQLQSTLAGHRRVHGDEHANTLTTGYVLGRALVQARRCADAETQRAETQRAIQTLVELYEKWDRAADAAAWRARLQ